MGETCSSPPGRYDYIVIGSGFGGAVAALRLTEKGYSVLVVEKGRRWKAEDFPRTSWDLRKFLWAPALSCRGIQAITLLRDVLVLHGTGVGGGSLVYANTLMRPSPEAFSDPKWSGLLDWEKELAPHFETASRMLGVAPNPRMTSADEALLAEAKELGAEATFCPTEVAVFFGEEGKESPDPYFGGKGPPRRGCAFCGGCMVGCREGGKNTLDKNYLWFAESNGAEILPDTRATLVEPLPGGGYRVSLERLAVLAAGRRFSVEAGGVVFAGGVLGTVPLLMECRRRGALPLISDQLGEYARTNSEALLGVTAWGGGARHCEGLAITSHFYLKDGTRVEPVRYPDGSDSMFLLGTPLTGPGTRLTRPLKWLLACLLRPHHFLRTLWPFGKARRSVILLFMQAADNRTRLVMKRRLLWPFARRLTSRSPPGAQPVPPCIPAANALAASLAKRLRGVPQSTLNEVLLNVPTTAHILGGCAMGRSPEEGVTDAFGRLFGYKNLFVADGSLIGANLGVNPSLTILALAEHAMAAVPPK